MRKARLSESDPLLTIFGLRHKFPKTGLFSVCRTEEPKRYFQQKVVFLTLQNIRKDIQSVNRDCNYIRIKQQKSYQL